MFVKPVVKIISSTASSAPSGNRYTIDVDARDSMPLLNLDDAVGDQKYLALGKPLDQLVGILGLQVKMVG